MSKSNCLVDLKRMSIILSKIKSQQIENMPHYAHDALFFKNNCITTGLLNNKTEALVHIPTGSFLYHEGEHGELVDLTKDDFINKIKIIADRKKLTLDFKDKINPLNIDNLKIYNEFARKSSDILETFRMKLSGYFTQVHFWPEGFDMSIEWFLNQKRYEQIGIGISPGEEIVNFIDGNQKKITDSAYLYLTQFPFNDKIFEEKLPMGNWNKQNWKGIVLQWDEVYKKSVNHISTLLIDLFNLIKNNFSILSS